MTRKQQELSFTAAILGTIILIIGIALYKSGKLETYPAPKPLSFQAAKAYCDSKGKGWRLPTSDELKELGKTGWASNYAPEKKGFMGVLSDKPQHECMLSGRDHETFCVDTEELPVYCVK